MSKMILSALAAATLATTLAAGDLEFSVGYGLAFPGNRNLYLDHQDAAGHGTFVQTRFQGPWNEPALELGYELFKVNGTRTWLRAGYASALSGLAYSKVGEQVTPTSIQTQTFNGTAKDSQMMVGLGLTYDTGKLGEYGAALYYRSNRINLSGTVVNAADTGSNFTATPAAYAQAATVADLDLRLSMALVQTFPTCKTFQRISMDWGFGASSGTVNGDTSDWQLTKAYLQRLKPSSGFQFAFGVRL